MRSTRFWARLKRRVLRASGPCGCSASSRASRVTRQAMLVAKRLRFACQRLASLSPKQTLAQWLKKAGDQVSVDEALVSLETDKAAMDVPAPVAGTITKVFGEEGDTVEVGALCSRSSKRALAPVAAAPAASGGTSPGRCRQRLRPHLRFHQHRAGYWLSAVLIQSDGKWHGQRRPRNQGRRACRPNTGAGPYTGSGKSPVGANTHAGPARRARAHVALASNGGAPLERSARHGSDADNISTMST